MDLHFTGGRIIFGSYDCHLYCLDDSGKKLWAFPTSLSYMAPIDTSDEPEVQQVTAVWTFEEEKKEERYRGPELNIDFTQPLSKYVKESEYTAHTGVYKGKKKNI